MADQHANAESTAPLTEEEWRDRARTMLRVELTRQKVTYEELVRRLGNIGVKETEPGVRNKLSRGTFPATFLLQCMEALGHQLIPFPTKPYISDMVKYPSELLRSIPVDKP